MTEQYFKKQPKVKSEEKEFSWHLLDEKFVFVTDNGVFSKNSVDYGSISLIKAFIKDYKKGNSLLDLGCGYGPIGIIISKLIDKLVIDMCDINLRAIELSEKNIINNRVKNISAYQSDHFENINKKYDIILLNPPIRAGKKTIYKMYEESIKYLNENGSFYIVIKKKQGAISSKNKLSEIYGNCESISKDKGYIVFKSIKYLDKG